MDSWMYASASTHSSRANENDDAATQTKDSSPSVHSGTGAAVNRDTASPLPSGDVTRTALASSRIRRRNRTIQSCLECRRRKLKCDKQAPCTNCVRFRRDCLYLTPATDAQSQQKLAEMKERFGALEQNLGREVDSKSHAEESASSAFKPGGVRISEDEIDADEEDEVQLEPTPLANRDNVYDETVNDEFMDLGVQMGKLRISERIGGWSRPKLAEELADTLADIKSSKSRWSTTPTFNDYSTLLPSETLLPAPPRSYIGPGPDYIAPAASLLFAGTNTNTNLIDYLPSRRVADQLISHYWLAVHGMCTTVHRPTFEAQYRLFWAQISASTEPMAFVQAVVFAAMFSAAASMNNEEIAHFFGTTKHVLVDNLRSGTEMALVRANLLRTTRVQTMQAFVMYLLPLARSEVSRAHSALVGCAIRLAECIGLHRDGTFYNLTPLETHVRRLIWHQLCFLDMRTCEAIGPRLQIRQEDYDTKMPLNVNETDFLNPLMPVKDDANHWTDMTFSRIRMEVQEMRRIVWFDIVQIDEKKKSITSVLVKIQRWRATMEEKYFSMVDESVPFQKLARLVYEMGSNGLHLQTLHRYLFNTTQRMTDRLRQVLIEAGLRNMEAAIAFEKSPEMQIWTWYRGAFSQFHAALLLMHEVYAYPMRKGAPRIWKCLDYIFEVPAHLAPKLKAELILTDLRDRMEVIQQMRRTKASSRLEERIGSYSLSMMADSLQPGSAAIDAQGQIVQQSHSPPVPADTSAAPPIISGSQADFYPIQNDSVRESVPASTVPAVIMSSAMDDIDWTEWEKVFSPEIYTGDLNTPNFNMGDFTGDFAQSASAHYDPATAARMQHISSMATAGLDTRCLGPSPASADNVVADELDDVSFAPQTFFARSLYERRVGAGDTRANAGEEPPRAAHRAG